MGALHLVGMKHSLLLGTKDKFAARNFDNLAQSIVNNENCFTGLYPPIFQKFAKYGIYVFKFFKDYQFR